MIQLGDNIILEGFDDLEPALLIVMKKLIGSFAKRLSEEKGEFDKLEVKKEDSKITAKVAKGDKSFEEKADQPNLFFTLSKALGALEKKTTF